MAEKIYICTLKSYEWVAALHQIVNLLQKLKFSSLDFQLFAVSGWFKCLSVCFCLCVVVCVCLCVYVLFTFLKLKILKSLNQHCVTKLMLCKIDIYQVMWGLHYM